MATPLMNLSLPVVSSTAGPTYATMLNAALTVIDGHDHSTGKGTKVTPTGLNINADLSFGGFNATNVRSLRMVNHSAPLALPTDAACLSASGGNLYYNNGAGASIQITAGAALNAASIGAIGGDYSTSTASVFYTAASQVFSFWQDANKSASLDVGRVTIRQPGVVSPFGITVQSPNGLAAAYSLTLPAALPAATKPLGIGSTGILSAVDGFTLTDAAAILLDRAGAQTILKGGTGKLQIGTSVNEDVELLRNGSAALALTSAGIDAKSQKISNVVDPAAAQDAATKGYVDGKFPAVAWTTFAVNTGGGWVAGSGADAPAYWKDPSGVVHLRGYATAGGPLSTTIAGPAVPVGCRPLGSRVLPLPNVTDSIVDNVASITPANGNLVFLSGAPLNGTAYGLDGIVYVAEQ
jgi:hypothetical protein